MKIPGSFHVSLITPWHPPNSVLPDQNVVSSPSWPVVRGRLTLHIQERCREPLDSLRSLYMGRGSLSFLQSVVVVLFCWGCELVEESYIIRGGRTGNSECDHLSKAAGSPVCLSALLLESGMCRALRGADISQQKPPTYPTPGGNRKLNSSKPSFCARDIVYIFIWSSDWPFQGGFLSPF